jgi:methyl-accepting chemotaxis protein
MGNHFSRRRYIVDWKLQGSLCTHGLLYGGLVLAAVIGGIFAPLLWDLTSTNTYVEEQAIVMLYMHERLWFLVLVCAVIVALSALKMSHRIAGPLVRYKRNLRLVAGGKLPTPLRTRAGDYLQEEVRCLNAAIAGIGERVDTIKNAAAAVRAGVDAIAAAGASLPDGRIDALLAASRELDRALGAITHCDPGDERAPADAAEPVIALAGAGDAAP